MTIKTSMEVIFYISEYVLKYSTYSCYFNPLLTSLVL